MVRRSRFVGLVSAALVAAACGSAVAPSPLDSNGPAASGSPSVVSTPPSSSEPLAPGPAWQAVLKQVGPDGSISKDTALQAFSLAIGPLPGVTLPPGEPGAMPSGSMALRALGSHWSELSAEQKQAAIELVPELAELAPTSMVPDTAIPVIARPGGVGPVSRVAAQKRTNAYYTELVNQAVIEIGTHLNPPVPFNMTVEARVGLPESATSAMETGVYSKSGGDRPTKCAITVGPLGDAASDADVDEMIYHETWHCYEGAIVGLARYWSDNPAPWIIEGEAEWVGASLAPASPQSTLGWDDYLTKPGAPLFSQAYSAVGFYAHLESSGTDPWGKLVPTLMAATNATAFTASGADSDGFLDSWGSSFLRDAGRGAPWEVTGPGLTADKAAPTPIQVSNGGSVAVSVAAYTNEIAALAGAHEVLIAAFSGHARISDGSDHDYVIGDSAAFCLRANGCVCPGASGEPPPLPLEGDLVALGVTGGPKGASGTLSGLRFEDFCSPLTGHWVGTWRNDNGLADGGFTIEIVQKGNTFTGTSETTGKTCVRHGTSNGTLTGNKITFGEVSAARNISFTGTVSGNKMSGTWEAIACGTVSFSLTGTWDAVKQK